MSFVSSASYPVVILFCKMWTDFRAFNTMFLASQKNNKIIILLCNVRGDIIGPDWNWWGNRLQKQQTMPGNLKSGIWFSTRTVFRFPGYEGYEEYMLFFLLFLKLLDNFMKLFTWMLRRGSRGGAKIPTGGILWPRYTVLLYSNETGINIHGSLGHVKHKTKLRFDIMLVKTLQHSHPQLAQ